MFGVCAAEMRSTGWEFSTLARSITCKVIEGQYGPTEVREEDIPWQQLRPALQRVFEGHDPELVAILSMTAELELIDDGYSVALFDAVGLVLLSNGSFATFSVHIHHERGAFERGVPGVISGCVVTGTELGAVLKSAEKRSLVRKVVNGRLSWDLNIACPWQDFIYSDYDLDWFALLRNVRRKQCLQSMQDVRHDEVRLAYVLKN